MTSRKPIIGPVFLMVVIITMVLPSGALAQAFYMPPRHHGITQDNIVPGEIIVKLKKDRGKPLIKEEEKNGSIETNFPSLNTLNKKFGARSIRLLHQGWNKPTKKRLPSRAQAMRKDLGSVYAIRLGNHTNLSAALAEYKKDENVEYAEPNYLAFTTATILNDPEFSKQWALNNTGQTGGTADAMNHMKSPMIDPNCTFNAGEKPPRSPRRIVSIVTGPGGRAELNRDHGTC